MLVERLAIRTVGVVRIAITVGLSVIVSAQGPVTDGAPSVPSRRQWVDVSGFVTR